MRRWFLKIHFWLAVPFGIIISVICLTGALLVFEKEVTDTLNRDLLVVEAEPASTRLSEQELIKRVVLQMGDTLQAPVLTWGETPESSCQMQFANTGRKILFVDPYTGNVLGWNRSYEFFRITKRIHRWLLDMPEKKGEMTTGKLVVGCATLAMVSVLVTGLFLWFPKSWRVCKTRLSVSFSKGARRMVYDFHLAFGFYASLFLLVMALTGLTWSFPDYRDWVFSMFPEGYEFLDIKRIMYAIHVGRWGGMITKIIWFAVALTGGLLPVTGYVMWYKKLASKKQRAQAASSRRI